MRIVAGILLVVGGMIFPMGLVAWLNSRLNRAPRPASRQVGLALALNGLLPVALVTLGLGLISERLWALIWLRGVAFVTGSASGIVLVALLVTTLMRRRDNGR